jgi:hypothetical protein
MSVTPDTPVTITMGKLIGAILVLLGGGWAIVHFTVGGVQDDEAIRSEVGGLQTALRTSDKGNLARTDEVSEKLTQQISGLRVDLANQIGGLRSDLGKLQVSLASYSKQMDFLSKNLDKNIGSLNNRLNKFDTQLTYMQAAWRDPKQMQMLADQIKKASANGQTVVIVPLIPQGQLDQK